VVCVALGALCVSVAPALATVTDLTSVCGGAAVTVGTHTCDIALGGDTDTGAFSLLGTSDNNSSSGNFNAVVVRPYMADGTTVNKSATSCISTNLEYSINACGTLLSTGLWYAGQWFMPGVTQAQLTYVTSISTQSIHWTLNEPGPTSSADSGNHGVKVANLPTTQTIAPAGGVLNVNCSSGCSGGGGGTTSLTGDSLQAVEDTRQGVFYLVGLICALIFAYTFWRTFGRNT